MTPIEVPAEPQYFLKKPFLELGAIGEHTESPLLPSFLGPEGKCNVFISSLPPFDSQPPEPSCVILQTILLQWLCLPPHNPPNLINPLPTGREQMPPEEVG